MRVHHLDCATMCPLGGRLVSGTGSVWSRARLVCHVLVVELADGLALVDTGLGLEDVAEPRRRLGAEFVLVVQPKLDASQTAARQVETLGFKAADVRHVVLTHLDLDHAGGLADFPDATVHVLAEEHHAAMARRTRNERRRYRSAQWDHAPRWSLYKPEGEPWFGFECVRGLEGLPPEILIVPLVGHTRGHAGVAVESDGGWLLHAGDAYFHRSELDPDRRRCPPILDVFQRVLAVNGPARVANQERLRQLALENAGNVHVFSAHDPVELDRFA